MCGCVKPVPILSNCKSWDGFRQVHLFQTSLVFEAKQRSDSSLYGCFSKFGVFSQIIHWPVLDNKRTLCTATLTSDPCCLTSCDWRDRVKDDSSATVLAPWHNRDETDKTHYRGQGASTNGVPMGWFPSSNLKHASLRAAELDIVIRQGCLMCCCNLDHSDWWSFRWIA